MPFLSFLLSLDRRTRQRRELLLHAARPATSRAAAPFGRGRPVPCSLPPLPHFPLPCPALSPFASHSTRNPRSPAAARRRRHRPSRAPATPPPAPPSSLAPPCRRNRAEEAAGRHLDPVFPGSGRAPSRRFRPPRAFSGLPGPSAAFVVSLAPFPCPPSLLPRSDSPIPPSPCFGRRGRARRRRARRPVGPTPPPLHSPHSPLPRYAFRFVQFCMNSRIANQGEEPVLLVMSAVMQFFFFFLELQKMNSFE